MENAFAKPVTGAAHVVTCVVSIIIIIIIDFCFLFTRKSTAKQPNPKPYKFDKLLYGGRIVGENVFSPPFRKTISKM